MSNQSNESNLKWKLKSIWQSKFDKTEIKSEGIKRVIDKFREILHSEENKGILLLSLNFDENKVFQSFNNYNELNKINFLPEVFNIEAIKLEFEKLKITFLNFDKIEIFEEKLLNREQLKNKISNILHNGGAYSWYGESIGTIKEANLLSENFIKSLIGEHEIYCKFFEGQFYNFIDWYEGCDYLFIITDMKSKKLFILMITDIWS